MKKLNKWVVQNLHWLIVLGVAVLCAIFLIAGHTSENGKYITLDGSDAQIEEYTTDFIEDANEALNRVMNEDTPTDQDTIDANDDEATGQGFYTTIDAIIGRMLANGNNDGGNGWQCSRYTGYLATGKWSYSISHPDYGPVNGKDVAAWLVKNYGFKYIDTPVKGAIGSGGFNTAYGHTAMYLYSTGTNTAMVNDANYTPLTVSTHNMNISGWVWVVPGSYEPATNTETETNTGADTGTDANANTDTAVDTGTVTYTYVKGDYFSKVLVELGYDEGKLWGEDGSVRYYTNQLIEQGVLDSRGNVKIGVPFTLTRR